MTGLVFIATSLDGYIARADGGLDWLDFDSGGGPPSGPDADHGYAAFYASCDALLMGRATFETVLGFGIEWPYGEKPVRVASRTLRQEDVPAGLDRVRVVAGEPAEIAAGLDAEGFDRVYVDGGKLIQDFLRAGLIREMTVNVIPVLIGEGIPLFGSLDADVRLRHLEARSFRTGLVQVRYEVLG